MENFKLRKRLRKVPIEEDITVEEWKKHFAFCWKETKAIEENWQKEEDRKKISES